MTRSAIHPLQAAFTACLLTAVSLTPQKAYADEGGVSMWLPGTFGSLAATPLQPGWTLSTTLYHTSVSAGGDVGLAREIGTGRIPLNLVARANVNLDANVNLLLFNPTYVFASPILGGQATLGVMGVFGRNDTSLQGNITGFLSTPLGPIPFSRTDKPVRLNDRLWRLVSSVHAALERWRAQLDGLCHR
jgi:hypothetical protein